MTIPTTDMPHGVWCYCAQCIANPKPATEELIARRSAAACSPSSDTPETDANTYRASTLASADHIIPVVHAEFARRLERERDAARRDLREIITAVSLSELFPGDAHEWLKSHPENAQVEARRK